MEKYQDSIVVQNINGQLIVGTGALVQINVSGTSSPASIFSDNLGTVAVNPIVANSQGYFEFYAVDGYYDLIISGVGIQTFIETAIKLQSTNFALLAGNSAQVFNAAPAVTNTEVVQLSQSTAGAILNNVTASRAFFTTYTNTSQRVMDVYMFSVGSATLASGLQFYLNGVVAGVAYSTPGVALSVNFRVLPNGTYSIVSSTNNPPITAWLEAS